MGELSGAVHTAWSLIGFGDDGEGYVRIVGGHALYESVGYRDDTPGGNVCLQRLSQRGGRLRVVTRYVDPDTLMEVVPDGG